MNPHHYHVAHLVPTGFRQPPVLEALAKLVAKPEAGEAHRTECEVKPGVWLTVDWTVTEDDGLCLHSVWAGPVELYRSEMLEGWAVDKCYAAAELDEREVAEEV